MPEIAYVTIDVFTADRFGGNPLAVIPDARALTDRQMQQIAAEFNYSESTFILPPRDPGNTAQVRIFTRTSEIPFAGHPNVGTGFVLGRQQTVFGTDVGPTMRFEEKAGLVDVDLTMENGLIVGAMIKAPGDLETGPNLDVATMAECVSLPSDAIVEDRHAPTRVSVGLPFYMAETDITSLSMARPDAGAFAATVERHGLTDAGGRLSTFLYARTGDGVGHLRARMFSPLGGTVEDPATGSACAALGAFLLSLDERAEAQARILIEQGVEMGRPSEIAVDVRKAGGRVESVAISGRCVPVTRGVIEI